MKYLQCLYGVIAAIIAYTCDEICDGSTSDERVLYEYIHKIYIIREGLFQYVWHILYYLGLQAFSFFMFLLLCRCGEYCAVKYGITEQNGRRNEHNQARSDVFFWCFLCAVLQHFVFLMIVRLLLGGSPQHDVCFPLYPP